MHFTSILSYLQKSLFPKSVTIFHNASSSGATDDKGQVNERLCVWKEQSYNNTLDRSRKQNKDSTNLNNFGFFQGKLKHVLTQISKKDKCTSIFS